MPQADDGWTSVKYRGELLKTYRPKRPLEAGAADAAAAADEGPKRKKARRAPARYQATDDGAAEDEASCDQIILTNQRITVPFMRPLCAIPAACTLHASRKLPRKIRTSLMQRGHCAGGAV